MTTTKQVAQWMVDRLEECEGMFLQVDAVAGIESEFGNDFTYISEIGEKSINRNVLAQFRKLTGDDVVWVTLHGGGFWAGAHWRKREPGDALGRTQYQSSPPQRLTIARTQKRREFLGIGTAIQTVGCIVFLVGILLSITGRGMLLGVAGIIICLLLLIIGGRMAVKLFCSQCGNKLSGHQVRFCPVCDTQLAR